MTAEAVLDRDGLATLLSLLREDGYRLIGPTVRDGAIVHAEISGIDELPADVGAEQQPGRYRLTRRGDGALFGWANGPQSWKPLFFAPRVPLVQLRRNGRSFTDLEPPPAPPPIAIIGARACDLAAIAVQDRVLRDGPFRDDDYAARRGDVFVIAVQCGCAGGNCFCVSMKTGPRAREGFDLALTELLEGGHRFVAEVGSARGAALLARVRHRQASDDERRQADALVAGTARSMGRQLDTNDLAALLMRNLEHPRWDEVAERCLGCTNCTLVCPTCFCSSVEDVTDLEGETATRWRRWDSCFTVEHSYLHGGSVRSSIRTRYRQWLTHKLATWIEQFGTSGCVGCGRCITWCPVGIDLTDEAAAIRATDGATKAETRA